MKELIIYNSIATRSGHVGYVVIGSGKPLVMLVGYSGTLFHWNNKVIYALSKHHTLYLIDNRYVGLSESDNEASTHGMALDLLDFIEAKGIEKPLVLGWSMGGTVAQELACSYSSKISGLILMATVPNNSYISMDFMLFMATMAKYTQDEFKEHIYHFFFSKTLSIKAKDYITSTALKFSDYHYRYTQKAKNFQDLAIISWNGVSPLQLQQIDLPVLLLRAKDDLVVNIDALQFFLKYLKHPTLIEYQSGGHFLVHDQPELIAKDILTFTHHQNIRLTKQ
jgi:pimeloyl-ACP methyl ester carboxylesterase